MLPIISPKSRDFSSLIRLYTFPLVSPGTCLVPLAASCWHSAVDMAAKRYLYN